MKKYDTLIFDLDGTLSISKSPLDDDMAELLSKASHYLNIVIITGGRFEQIKKQVMDRFPKDVKLENVYILPTSGSSLWKYNTESQEWETVYNHALSQDQKKRITDALNNALARASFDIDPAILEGPQIEDRDSQQITLSALGQKQDPKIKAVWDPNREKRRELLGFLTDLEDEFDIKLGGGTSIDVTLKGIDKAFGINEFYTRTGFDIAKGLFVGDQIVPGGNDFAATKTGIDTRDTTGPEETMKIIHETLRKLNSDVVE